MCLGNNVELNFGLQECYSFDIWKGAYYSFELQPLIPPPSTTAGNKLYFLKEREIR